MTIVSYPVNASNGRNGDCEDYQHTAGRLEHRTTTLKDKSRVEKAKKIRAVNAPGRVRLLYREVKDEREKRARSPAPNYSSTSGTWRQNFGTYMGWCVVFGMVF